MEFQAEVCEVRGLRARLAIDPGMQCGSCGPGGGCGTRLFGPRAAPCLHVDIGGDGCAPFAPGDRVIVSVSDADFLRSARLAYLVPVAGLLAGAGMARFAGLGESLAPVTALAGALLGVWLGRRRGAGRLRAVHPVSLRG